MRKLTSREANLNRITERKTARRESRSDPQSPVCLLQNQEYKCSYSLLYFLNLKNIFLESKQLIIQNRLNSVPSLAGTDSRKAAAPHTHTHTLGYPTRALTSHRVRTKAKYNCPSASEQHGGRLIKRQTEEGPWSHRRWTACGQQPPSWQGKQGFFAQSGLASKANDLTGKVSWLMWDDWSLTNTPRRESWLMWDDWSLTNTPRRVSWLKWDD